MYPISALFADRLRRPDRTFLVKATINGEEYDNTSIVDFQIENSLTLSDEFQIGTAIPSKLLIKLRTADIIPANAKITPYISMSLGDMTWQDATYPWEEMVVAWLGGGTDWMPLGEFYVDSREKINDVWAFTCYDKLVFADAAYVSALQYPASQQAIFNEILSKLGWATDSSVTINPNYMVQTGPTGYTMRQVLSYIAAANSASLVATKNGLISFKRFAATNQPVFTMTSADYVRVKQTNPIKTYSRVVVTYNTEDNLTYEAGTGSDANTLFLENPFMTQAQVNSLCATLNGFSYLPLTMDARGYPQLEQGDVISYEVDEGRSWTDSTFAWNEADLAWNGMSKYQTVILHQVLSFKGGLKMSLEAPSESEQKSEFQVDGSLTKAINDLNKNAVKEGKSYFGLTVTRTDGLTIERDDHLSKLIMNSDVMDWQVKGESALYFDAWSKKLKFGGDLEAAGGTFSGNLSAAGGTFSGDLSAAGGTFTGTLVGVDGTFSGTLNAATINGGTIKGAQIIGGSITSNTDINVTNDIRVGNNIYLGVPGQVTDRRISFMDPSIYEAYTSFSALSRELKFRGANDVRMDAGLNAIINAGFDLILQAGYGVYIGSSSDSNRVAIAGESAYNMSFDSTTRNLKLWSKTGDLLAQVNIP